MLRWLHLERFKSHRDTRVELGPFSVLVGTNASGKSNVRDALRFLHGVARGYTLAEILGEKWGDGGVLQWSGIRGGPREVTFQGAESFAIEVGFDITIDGAVRPGTYRIEVAVPRTGHGAQLVSERLRVEREVACGFDCSAEDSNGSPSSATNLRATLLDPANPLRQLALTVSSRSGPLLSGLRDGGVGAFFGVDTAVYLEVLHCFSSIRFLDFDLDAMRRPSFPGQIVLGDRGENLPSVLQAAFTQAETRGAIIEWIRRLTPMDIEDLRFESGPSGKLTLVIVERGGHTTTADSASDGTLRFLTLVAALLGPEPARLYVLEELERGIHPARLHLILDLIEERTRNGRIQVISTTHSPALLAHLRRDSLEHTSLTYRLEGSPETRVRPVLDVPMAREVLETQDIQQLHTSGWLEDAVAFTEERPAS